MRIFVASCLLFLSLAYTASADEARNEKGTIQAPSIEAIRVEEDLHLCGGVSWSMRVTTLHRVDQAHVEQLKAQASRLAGVKVEELLAGEAGEKYVMFFPTSVATEIPVMTQDKTFNVIELRTAKQPHIEQIRFFHDATGVSSVARFKAGTSSITQLESLLQIAKATEAQNAVAMKCGAESCGTTGCTECAPSCGCTDGSSAIPVSLVALTPSTSTDNNTCTSCCPDCAECTGGQALKMTQIDERTFSFERLQK